MKYDLTNPDHIWELCLAMWRWVKAEKQAGSEKSVAELKVQWLKDNGWDLAEMNNWCFFCHYDYIEGDGNCSHCPARDVDEHFSCLDGAYRYDWNPIGFCELIEKLDERRNDG